MVATHISACNRYPSHQYPTLLWNKGVCLFKITILISQYHAITCRLNGSVGKIISSTFDRKLKSEDIPNGLNICMVQNIWKIFYHLYQNPCNVSLLQSKIKVKTMSKNPH